MAKTFHNTHILMPNGLWQKLKKHAKAEDKTVTDVMLSAVTNHLEVYSSNRSKKGRKSS